MSKHSMKEITCPQCGNKQNYMIWESLNGDLDPEAKKRLIDGTFFAFKCEQCGHEANIVYDILYHDMSHNTMVYFVHPDKVETTMKYMSDAQKNMANMVSGVGDMANNIMKTRNRIVTDQNRLREKAIIFEAGLDDRVIEIIKLLCWFEVSKKLTSLPDDALYFYIDKDGEYKVEVVGGVATCGITREMYENTAKQFANVLEVIGEQYIVDNNFAGNVCLTYNKHARGQK